MPPLPPQMLPAVPHVSFGIFNFALPDIIAWLSVLVIVLLAASIRLPGFFLSEAPELDVPHE